MQPVTPFPACRDLSRSYGKGWGRVKENKKISITQQHSATRAIIVFPLLYAFT